ncbi:endonuclease MutS2 [Lactobacillus sp. S2-2]|uniref:endonuclease MutS2 n=1 Tax=Lactobacillus sp. S2-2 TaxID=2692917 RepID=UPI001F3DE9CB|nr:endonuclease MutS2 [Lactobacillus sp. S2-2]MCF6515817.1 endonuclease MutS2 [Lactobacillus sp. S2-2]
MNSKIIETLEYNKIKEKIANYILTEKGLDDLNQLEPSNNKENVKDMIDETADGYRIYQLNKEIPIPKVKNINPLVQRLAIDANLSGTEFSTIRKILIATDSVKNFFEILSDDKVDLTRLYNVVDELYSLPELTKKIKISIDYQGNILDSASRELFNIRRKIIRFEDDIKGKMNKYTSGKYSKYLSEGIVTFRNSRYVIPVKAEYKNMFGGIVHDESASGQTLYIEPSSVISLNNDLKRFQLDEIKEEKKILMDLSNMIRPYQLELTQNSDTLAKLDLISAKAKYAGINNYTKPIISENNVIQLKNAKHPLIYANKVIGNDISIGEEYNQIVITGPNTGGKTITIKTIGLLQLMAQSGMFISCNEESQIAVLDDIFADIGDDQSIEQNLSTFSSHMENIINILKQMNNNSLILIDELGSGTDPKEGAALAMSILEWISNCGAKVIATTHYPELKVYGYNHPKTINASMEFDDVSLKPTYKLLIGIPGKSNALNIAKRLGLNTQIIDNANNLFDDDSQKINNMIEKLTTQAKRAEDKADELENSIELTNDLYNDLEKNYTKYKENKEHMLFVADQKANEIVSKTKKKADDIIADLRSKQTKANHNIKENELIDAKGEINSLERNPIPKNNRVLRKAKAKKQFKENDDVLVKSYGQKGVLLKKSGETEWNVQIGILKMKIDEDDLEKINVDTDNNQYKPSVRKSSSAGVSTSLDLRGERYENAMNRLESYLDSAMLAGYPSVTIIHGKGTGALREGVINHLKNNRRIASYEFSSPSNGGDGSMVVNFK